jgi:hypothetical protein
MHCNMQRYLENVHIYGLPRFKKFWEQGNRRGTDNKKSSVTANIFLSTSAIYDESPPPPSTPSTRDYKKTVVGLYGSLFPRVGKKSLDHDKKGVTAGKWVLTI